MIMSTIFKARLSEEQIKVVNHIDGPLLVEAGPGSGKTRVLTERIRALLTNVPGHFRILALTFTNKAAEEMRERLADLDDVRDRTLIGTLHGFCLEVLTERGKWVGIDGVPNIFEQQKDRKEILLRAIDEDPYLIDELNQIDDSKERNKRVDTWLNAISNIKSNPITRAVIDDELDRRVMEAYEAGMRASNAYDFDDLLNLTYQLFLSQPEVADIYRRLYKYICIDEAQDMNEAQYAVISALCQDGHRNIMMVGDPKQSIYGFNNSSPKYMMRFQDEFDAQKFELNANYRSSRAVVSMAQSLDSNYMVSAQLAIDGDLKLIVGEDEEHEARLVVEWLLQLIQHGHPDVEGGIELSKCAVLGRTKFALLAIERLLKEKGIPFYKRLTSNHENESKAVDDFLLALRVLANPKDRLHTAALAKKWKVAVPETDSNFLDDLSIMAKYSSASEAEAIFSAIKIVATQNRLDFLPALKALEGYADQLSEPERLAVYQDTAVFRSEWDQYLRNASGTKNLAGFLSSKALGGTQKMSTEGVALLTVHSSKGLEFDVVIVAGMAEGTFPDYRAVGKSQLDEERRNAFVAATRSKRLLYFSYPASRVMPWGGVRGQSKSRYLTGVTNRIELIA